MRRKPSRQRDRARAIEESMATHVDDVVQIAPYEPEYDTIDWDELFRGILDDDRTDVTM